MLDTISSIPDSHDTSKGQKCNRIFDLLTAHGVFTPLEEFQTNMCYSLTETDLLKSSIPLDRTYEFPLYLNADRNGKMLVVMSRI